MKEHPSYYTVLPSEVRYDKELLPMEKIMYSEIVALANKNGVCWASNGYFADLYEVKKETVSAWISKLEKKGYIKTKINQKEGNTRIMEIGRPINFKRKRPIPITRKHNNTRNNNTSEYEDNKKKPLTPDDDGYWDNSPIPEGWELEEEGKITSSSHRKGTFGDSIMATFPKL